MVIPNIVAKVKINANRYNSCKWCKYNYSSYFYFQIINLYTERETTTIKVDETSAIFVPTKSKNCSSDQIECRNQTICNSQSLEIDRNLEFCCLNQEIDCEIQNEASGIFSGKALILTLGSAGFFIILLLAAISFGIYVSMKKQKNNFSQE